MEKCGAIFPITFSDCGGIFTALNFSGQKFSRTKSPPPCTSPLPSGGGPHCFRAGDTIKSGPQVGGLATSPLGSGGSPMLQSGGQNQQWQSEVEKTYFFGKFFYLVKKTYFSTK